MGRIMVKPKLEQVKIVVIGKHPPQSQFHRVAVHWKKLFV